jgi:hypothetical protein
VKNYTIRPYEPNDFQRWNTFISRAKNATFLFNRDFMEYHGDRFSDHSLIIMDNQKWVAVLPANRVGDTLYSHQGLTYGGFVFSEKIKLRLFIGIFQKVLQYLKDENIAKLQIKSIPEIYCQYFSEETPYMLFLVQAKLWRRDCLTVIDLTKPFALSKDRKQCVRRGIRSNLVIKEDLNFELFWNTILIPNLEKKHGVKPVHSLEEIIKLQQQFPKNIRHFNVYHEDRLVAGTTVFITDTVAHPQYISGNDKKNELGSLDFLYHYLITDVFKDVNFFDFGTSNEENGTKMNEGLLFWKESFGARTIVQDYYEVDTAKVSLLENILI